MKVPLLDLHAQYEPILDNIKQEINQVLETHQYILGPQVKAFEEKMAKSKGMSYRTKKEKMQARKEKFAKTSSTPTSTLTLKDLLENAKVSK